jgi:predicted outer membrane protein
MKNRKLMCAAIAAVGAMMMCGNAAAQTQTSTTQTSTTNQTSTPAGTTNNTTTTYQSTTMGNMDMSNRMSVGDQIMLMNLVHANAMEIEASRIVQKQAATRAVYDYATMMITDHQALQNQLISQYGNQPWMNDWQNTLRKSRMYNSVGMSYYNNTNYMSNSTMDMNQTANTSSSTNGQNGSNGNMNAMNGQNPSNGSSSILTPNSGDNYMYLDASDWDRIHHLEGLQGYPLDKEYISMMVRDHKMLLDKLQNASDQTSNTDMRTLNGNVIGSVQKHLEEGRRLSFNFDDPFHLQRSQPWIH